VRASFFVCAWFALTVTAGAQTPAAAAPATAPPAQEPYTYQPDGRRDPFVSLVNGGTELSPARKGEGLAAFGVSEISVRGVMKTRDRLVAMVQGPDNKTYVIHQGDKLADGVVKSVTTEGLVVVQDITDPLSIQKQREVHKLLRSLEEAKE
jgi:type IV pilus assembly protein PilP